MDRAFTPPPTMAPMVRIDEQDHAGEIVLPAEDQFAGSAASFVETVCRIRATGADPDHAECAATTVRTAELLGLIAESATRVTGGTRA
ncbi:hypothetical protein [Streptomyces sp. Rer75]|uniref:hypothetical protein n=1 Tax=unclassified Streptomyces TaxID=2593676 RepID=UPI0015CF9ED1|nr:hypothetical protein [Streptomyces sp. Rer75]QLH26662.1 hypothetical protein HYQ63_43610 [Streptomyces sp. Rer75]